MNKHMRMAGWIVSTLILLLALAYYFVWFRIIMMCVFGVGVMLLVCYAFVTVIGDAFF